MSEHVLVARRFDFSASHRYGRAEWPPEKNRAVFGPCSNPNGHGHNYALEVVVRGRIDRETGMVINLADLKAIVGEVLLEFDHRNLNEDTPYFRERMPTTENLAAVLWERIAEGLARVAGGRAALHRLTLYEDEDLYVDYWRE